MKPSFHVRCLNGPFDDPGLYIRVLREGRALMFDLGFTTSLSAGDILKTRDIFLSHAHVDHFMGFDMILRTCLKRERTLRLYGPEGFHDRLEGKLNGYTWNLVEDYPLVMDAYEITGPVVRQARFSARNGFQREDVDQRPFDGSLMQDASYRVSAAVLDHRIPCLAFSLEEEYHINIDKAKLRQRELPVGPWLADLKHAIRSDEAEREFGIKGKRYSLSDLRDIATITRGQKISYVVDAAGSEENIGKIISLVRESDVLFIETYFLDQDREKARDRYHLTARDAGRVARLAEVKRLEAMHFSPRYRDHPQALLEEAMQEFQG